MSAITAYRTLLRIVGPAYVAVAFLGRVPLAMSQMGTLLLVSAATGRYALGGAAAGALAVANAIGAPFFGSLADRVGQRPVVLAQSWAGGAGLAAIVWTTQAGASPAAIVAVAALAGLATPQIGPLARVRWQPITKDAPDQRRLVDAAFSYEGAADEVSFVLGPATVGLLAVVVAPGDALLVAGGVLVAFGSWFALHPTAALTRPEVGATRSTAPVLTAVLGVLALAQLCIGMVFGATQTGSTVLATAQGEPGQAGLIHATLGVGSAIAGLAIAALPERIGYPTRMVASAAALLVLSAPLLLVQSIGQLVAVIALLGFAVAPYMISNFAMAGEVVVPERVGTAMTLLAGATGIGYALGSTLAGRLADLGGHTPAFAVTVSATALALVVSVLFRARRGRGGTRPDVRTA
ncbi:MFS family permease [Aeromicrobium sp. SORGH_AS981]|uniref:MFS transporter n=1 Tax=Aeromicrobium sp. SORGH_AS_0981 TaxID=3041802 RepID=UPI00285660F3|nr:MFS transporter [Aeromicrobium sp. SORGH_AS_0981]MDR6118325.1 MFS family permease [Aeromicrobium sp. SORGH_AS_0981]